jgi:predicted nucleotidyltransferase
MRLTEQEHRDVVEAIALADPEAQVWLHGSRVDDAARGGDIDLLVMSQRMGWATRSTCWPACTPCWASNAST